VLSYHLHDAALLGFPHKGLVLQHCAQPLFQQNVVEPLEIAAQRDSHLKTAFEIRKTALL
jgi:hypothetical protein